MLCVLLHSISRTRKLVNKKAYNKQTQNMRRKNYYRKLIWIFLLIYFFKPSIFIFCKVLHDKSFKKSIALYTFIVMNTQNNCNTCLSRPIPVTLFQIQSIKSFYFHFKLQSLRWRSNRCHSKINHVKYVLC